MDLAESPPEKELPGKEATSGSSCLPPQNQRGMHNEVDPSVRKSALKRTPIKQVVSQVNDQDPEVDCDDNTPKSNKKSDLSPDVEFLRSLSKGTKPPGVGTPNNEDVVLPEDTPGSRSDNSPEGSFQSKKKRKRSNGRSPEVMNEIEVSASILQLNEIILELIEFGKKNQNVHKPVKSLARKLRAAAERVTIDYKRTEVTRREEKIDSQQRETQLQHRVDELEKAKAEYAKKLKQAPDATGTCKICKKNTSFDLNCVDPEDLNSFRQYVTKPWPEGLFAWTTIAEKDKLGRVPDHVAVLSDKLFIDQKAGRTAKRNRLEEDVLDKFPEIDTEPPIQCSGGFSITLEEVSSFKIKASNKNIEKRRTVSVMLRHDDQGDNIEKAHGLLLEVKKVLLDAKANNAAIIAPTYINCKTLQKITECVFKDDQIEIQILVAKGALGSYATATRSKERPERGEALIIEASANRGYNSLLGTLKEKLNANTAAGIKCVKKTANGNLLLQLRGEAKAEQLKEKVEEALGTENIRMADGLSRKTVFIRGIDGMAEVVEIREALLAACTPEHADQVKLIANKNTRGEQSAVVTLVAKDAEKLLGMRTIRIGFSDCYIHERIKVDRCYKCWQFGHSARTCATTGIDMSDCCFKCGQTGHHKAGCASEKEFCPSCRLEGHQSGTGKCKSFRMALGNERKRRNANVASMFSGTTANHE